MERKRDRDRTRALVVVDDLFVQADNIIIVGDRDNNRRVAGVEDNRRNRDNGDVQGVIDDILDEICGRRD